MRTSILLILIAFVITHSQAQEKRRILGFEFEGALLNGVLNRPANNQPKGIVILVHGSGRTNAVEQEWYYDVRQAILQSGYATYMWDKKGCGQSGGTFDYNQSVQNSAREVIAAIQALKQKKITGSNKIGLWGISRAGWINPIVINQYPDIEFWISVSGVDDKENFKYLLEQNLRINGHPKDSVNLIVGEWVTGSKICHAGGSFEDYLAATPTLRRNAFWLRFTNGGITRDAYYAYQPAFTKEKLDKKTGLQVYIENFEALLSDITIPVLALFGEKDLNVDWRKTRALYESTLTNNELTIRTFPDCNHNLFQCNTGGFYEMEDNQLPWKRCDGFLDAITNWLNETK